MLGWSKRRLVFRFLHSVWNIISFDVSNIHIQVEGVEFETLVLVALLGADNVFVLNFEGLDEFWDRNRAHQVWNGNVLHCPLVQGLLHIGAFLLSEEVLQREKSPTHVTDLQRFKGEGVGLVVEHDLNLVAGKAVSETELGQVAHEENDVLEVISGVLLIVVLGHEIQQHFKVELWLLHVQSVVDGVEVELPLHFEGAGEEEELSGERLGFVFGDLVNVYLVEVGDELPENQGLFWSQFIRMKITEDVEGHEEMELGRMLHIFQFWKDFVQELDEGVEDDVFLRFRPDVIHHGLFSWELRIQFMDDLEELVEYDGETDHIFVVFFIAPEEGLLLLDQFHGQVHFQFFGIFHFLQRENGEVELDQEFEVVVDFSELFGGDLGVDQLQDHFLDILVPVFLHIDEVLDEIHILLELLRELLYFLIEYVDQGLVSLLLKDEVLESLLQLNQHLYFVRVVGGLEDFFRLRQEEVLVDLFALGQERVQGRRVDVLVEGIK